MTIRRLIAGQLVTALIAVLALIIAVTAFEAKTSEIQASRRDSRLDFCFLLRDLAVNVSPPSHRPAVTLFLAHSELANCRTYADRLPPG